MRLPKSSSMVTWVLPLPSGIGTPLEMVGVGGVVSTPTTSRLLWALEAPLGHVSAPRRSTMRTSVVVAVDGSCTMATKWRARGMEPGLVTANTHAPLSTDRALAGNDSIGSARVMSIASCVCGARRGVADVSCLDDKSSYLVGEDHGAAIAGCLFARCRTGL